jgi:hypothetical protein
MSSENAITVVPIYRIARTLRYNPINSMKHIYRSICLVLFVTLASAASQAQSTAVSTANFSTMVTLAPGGMATMGFVVASGPTNQSPGLYLIRAVGPSLAKYGITNPAPQPVFNVFNAQGLAVLGTVPSGGFPVTILPVAGNPPDWNAIFASVGAFPLVNGAQDTYAVLMVFTPGSYTIQVTDYSGKGGQVLIEVYASPTYVLFGG